MIYIGIDPGMHGGLCAIRHNKQSVSDDRLVVSTSVMPLSGGEIDAVALGEWVYNLVRLGCQCLAAVEKVHSMPKQGVASTFKFGMGYGKVLGVLGALHVPTELVTPQAWKKVVLAGTAQDKAAAIEYCTRACPEVKLILPKCRVPHDGIADAVCIAEYGRRTFQ